MARLEMRLLAVGIVMALTSLVCTAAPSVRVRKELRNLSTKEKQYLVTGLSTMLTIGTKQGQVLFGPDYREYDYFIVKHAVSVYDPRGDQGHAGPCFMTFHRAILLEFELALLSVVPQLGALPYWDITLDTRGGKYANTSNPNYIFSKNWAGSITGDPTKFYTVTDGLFAWHEVSYFDWDEYGHVSKIYNGSLSTGLLRSPDNRNNNTYYTRFTYNNTADGQASYSNLIQLPNPQPNEFNINYNIDDFRFCHDPSIVSDWMDWNMCIDLTPFLMEGSAGVPMITALLNTTRAPLLHTIPHLFVGGGSWDGYQGDFADVATSPNEFLLFMTHHANTDRSNMIWQANAAAFNATKANPNVLWDFPATVADWPVNRTGCYLNDVITSSFGISSIFPEPPASPLGYTHKEVLLNTMPGQAPYVYDNMYTPPPAIKRYTSTRQGSPLSGPVEHKNGPPGVGTRRCKCTGL